MTNSTTQAKKTLPASPRQFQMYIDGQFVDAASGDTITRNSPGHGVPVSTWPRAGVDDTERAIGAARRAFDTGPWSKLGAAERAKVLFKVADLIEQNADELGFVECLETGKPILQAIGEIHGAVDVWRFAAGAARTMAGQAYNNLGRLQIERLDVLLLHWAPAGGDIAPSLALLEQAADLGLAEHIGVSNYTAAMMHQAARLLRRPLATNQVEFHPLLDQRTLLAAAAQTGITLSSYCSVARGEVFKYPLFEQIGAAHGKSAAQVVLRWILQKGVAINTMSTRPANIAANFAVMDFVLSSVEMARIDMLGATNFRVVDKHKVAWAPEWD
jgi:diketogulonate reductase-like aldo/keto reductase